jgi:hypothetical protein
MARSDDLMVNSGEAFFFWVVGESAHRRRLWDGFEEKTLSRQIRRAYVMARSQE